MLLVSNSFLLLLVRHLLLEAMHLFLVASCINIQKNAPVSFQDFPIHEAVVSEDVMVDVLDDVAVEKVDVDVVSVLLVVVVVFTDLGIDAVEDGTRSFCVRLGTTPNMNLPQRTVISEDQNCQNALDLLGLDFKTPSVAPLALPLFLYLFEAASQPAERLCLC